MQHAPAKKDVLTMMPPTAVAMMYLIMNLLSAFKAKI
jgi:hypothetical protein